MKSSHALNLFMTPFLAWSQVAWKAGEMALAAAPVIGHRTRRLMLADSMPDPRDQREFTLMGQEKMAAGMESAQAVAMRMLVLNQQFAALAFRQGLSAAVALMSLAGSRTFDQFFQRQSKLAQDTITRSAVAASTLAGSSAQITGRALRPANSRIKGNARRLRRLRSR